MPTLVSDSVLLTVAMLLVSVPISLFHLVRPLRRQEIDVVNCHYLMEHYVHLVVAAWLTGVRVVISVHGADVDRYAPVSRAQRFLLRLVMRGATRIVACSEAMARQTREVFPAVGERSPTSTTASTWRTLRPPRGPRPSLARSCCRSAATWTRKGSIPSCGLRPSRGRLP